jgi:hypothetical protein
MKGLWPKFGCTAIIMAVLLGCAHQIETPDAAIAVAKKVCSKALRESKASVAWTASLSGEIWNVSGNPQAVYGEGFSVSVPPDSRQVPVCLETVTVPTEGSLHRGNPPQP